ncbi:MAG TPA: CoA activase, partial [Deltaproteobacteria bacterium]|nr:CoA activase [Deltaproteobacteria bacterium]
TSTKAVVMDRDKRVLAGFYTSTSGRPVDAMCSLCEAIDDLMQRKNITFNVIGSGTTGSGRKLIGGIVGADIVLDEITAHARAATELNPDVDTIIEIGGQDSKFTTLSKGRVNFSVMNAVCAAGTGSFIEEQARKMDCPLSEYSQRTQGIRSPISSDRCTVFMERDMNHYLCNGYTSDEVLASALHSVCENYLTKVAIEGSIGKTVFFQGATARNKALVAAFEQRLERPILVSKFCHVTGALGVALQLADDRIETCRFCGLDLYKKKIPLRSEVCSLCSNNCKLTIAEVDGRSIAYGFLCGRDYDTGKYVNNNTSGFDLLKRRSKIENLPRKSTYTRDFTIGIPSALHLFEDQSFWKCFFDGVSVPTVFSSELRDAHKTGKNLAGTEFCAPMTALYGHVMHLLDKADYVFVPYYFEDRQKNKDIRCQYCYYTQFAPSLVKALDDGRKNTRVLTPVVNYLYNRLHTKYQLYKMLKRITRGDVTLMDVSSAFDKAVKHKESCMKELQDCYVQEMKRPGNVSVVLLGRPYTVLSRSMNKAIVDIFAAKGVRVFFQDMVESREGEMPSLERLIDDIPWKFASRILQTAQEVGQTDGVYPVLVTSFRCSPDSFAADYFKKVMNSYDKPYLILQLDEHDSSVGYETRIEAAIRSFSNHFTSQEHAVVKDFPSIMPSSSLSGKTVLFPNWDPFSCRSIVASLQREGLDVRLLEEQHTSIARSLQYNTGQCIPINIMAQEYIDYIEKYSLDPGQCILWMANGQIACNLKLIPHHIKSILNSYGRGMEKAQVYQGNISFMDISLRAAINAYFAFMFGGMLRRLVCRIRPYEVEKGSTETASADCLRLFAEAFAGRMSKEDALRIMVHDFENIPVKKETRPKVAIFGDLYVRDNDLANQDLIRFVEESGGEVITTPYSTYAKMIAGPYFRKWFTEGKYLHTFSTKALFSTLNTLEKRYYKYFQLLLDEPDHVFDDSSEEILARYSIINEHTGESMDNILKIHYIKKFYPDVALFVQTSPAFCCPSLVTQAMARHIESITGVPIVNITYDGTFGDKNNVIIPYLAYPRKTAISTETEKAGGI